MKVICVKNDLQIKNVTIGKIYDANDREIDFIIVNDGGNFLCVPKYCKDVTFLKQIEVRDQKLKEILWIEN